MTICIAAMSRLGADRVIITASDRMVTSGDDTEYEPSQVKVGKLNDKACVLVAGPYSIHSEAISKTMLHLKEAPVDTVEKAAQVYAGYIKKFRLRFAEETILSPWNLTLPEFLEKQNTISAELVSSLNNKLETFDVPHTEAIVCGSDGSAMKLYHVDHLGRMTCHNDIGFLAIGVGASHAKTIFMGSGYYNNWPYYKALLTVYAAKKKAEIAPGVGKATDMFHVSQKGIETLSDTIFNDVEKVYAEYEAKRLDMVEQAYSDFEKRAIVHHMEQTRKIAAAQDNNIKNKA